MLSEEMESLVDNELLYNIINYNKSRKNYFRNNKTLSTFSSNVDYERILCARYMKVSRVKKRIVYLMARFQYVWFCTFTFDDYYISKCDRTKKDLIKKVLSLVSDSHYILNVDYGSKNEREHYHCILATNFDINLNKLFQENYSCFCSALKVRYNEEDYKRLSKYINKLSNHCIKDSTKNKRIIYNFKGYDLLFPTSQDKFIAYTLDKLALLDKANVSGKMDL